MKMRLTTWLTKDHFAVAAWTVVTEVFIFLSTMLLSLFSYKIKVYHCVNVSCQILNAC